MENKNILYTIAGILITFTFLFGVYLLINKPVNYTEINTIKPTDHIKWSPNKKHILVEYSDFQCPACKSFHDYMAVTFEASNSADSIVPKNITLVFRHFPLYQIHPNAFESAYAAESAGKQGKFFEMADLLFKEQEFWTKSKDKETAFVQLAEKLKLDIPRFKKDMKSKAIEDKVKADLTSGENAQIGGTPTYFLDGKKLEITSYEQFRNQLTEAVKQ